MTLKGHDRFFISTRMPGLRPRSPGKRSCLLEAPGRGQNPDKGPLSSLLLSQVSLPGCLSLL